MSPRLFALILITSSLLIACKSNGNLHLFYTTDVPKNSVSVIDGEFVFDSTKYSTVKTTIITYLKNSRDTLLFIDTLSQFDITGISFSKTVEIEKKSIVFVFFEYSDSSAAYFSLDRFVDTDVLIIKGYHSLLESTKSIGFYIRQSKKHNFNFR